MGSQAHELNPKAVKTILRGLRWLYAAATLFSFYSFIITESILDLVSVLLFLRFCISMYQLDSVYDRELINDYLETVHKRATFHKGLGRKTRRKLGISTKNEVY